MKHVSLQANDFDTATELARLGAHGAVASFTGHVRGDGGLVAMELEYYPGMTEDALADLADQALARWRLAAVSLIHRVGQLQPDDRIVFVGTAGHHRAAALEACAFLIDRLKIDAPFWKKERFDDGREQWVEARESDDAAAERWG